MVKAKEFYRRAGVRTRIDAAVVAGEYKIVAFRRVEPEEWALNLRGALAHWHYKSYKPRLVVQLLRFEPAPGNYVEVG